MLKSGILGGGQLGRMLLQAAANYPVTTYVMENSEDCPSAHLCHHFVLGDISDFEDVYNFGKHLDAITIEIESVNAEALQRLESEGVKVYPSSSALITLKNKILQKQFYSTNGIPTAAFHVTNNISELREHRDFLPAVHKVSKGGFDGRGVISINSEAELAKGFDCPAVLEKKVEISKEIAVIIAVGNNGQIAIYPPVEMIFDPDINILNYQLCPALLNEKTQLKIEAIAHKVVTELSSPGIFAVELFIGRDDNIWVNETAPRVHNSGHHTIEGCYSSQFDMLWRVLLEYPLGNTKTILPSAMVNIVGQADHFGAARYEGLNNVLKLENVFVHIYGKKETAPGRKMGHATILSNERQELVHTAMKVKHELTVTSRS